MSISDAKRKADLKYKAEKRKQLVLNYSTEDAQAIKDYCNAKGIQVASWIKGLIQDAMKNNI